MHPPTLQAYPSPGGALLSTSQPMATMKANEDAVLAAANIQWTKLRLARINVALESLNVLRRTISRVHLQDIDQKQQYLLDLERQQLLVQSDARHFTIVISRKEATSTAGIPEWSNYMERLVFYRHIGISIFQTKPDPWRDEVLEQVEAMSRRSVPGVSLPSVKSDDWSAGSDTSVGTLSPASAEHLLLFEESQVAVSYNHDSHTSSPKSEPLSSHSPGYDTDPGTPYVSEQGTESDSTSSGPMSPMDDFVHHELPTNMKPASPLSLHDYRPYPPIQIFHRQFLVSADAPKSRPFSYEDIYTLYDIFDKTGVEYYIFERKRDSIHQMEVKSCQKVDLLRPFVEISRRFLRPSTHTQVPLEILLRMSRVIVNSFSWPQPGETWREFLTARTEKYRKEKEDLDARIAPEHRRAEHADFCYSFMTTVAEYIGTNPALLDSVIDTTRLLDDQKWDYVLAYRCIWENLGLLRYSSPVKQPVGGTMSLNHSRARARPRLYINGGQDGISKFLGHNQSNPMHRTLV